VKIQKTTDYSIFSYFKENRQVKDSHVQHLVDSINTKNLLKYLPILVDKKMKVIDGQHRLEAAKVLKLPVYYVVMEDSAINDLWLLNSNVQKWGSEDFLNFYVRQGKPDYLLLDKFVKDYGFSVNFSLGILTFDEFRMKFDSFNAFKRGDFRIKDLAKARRVAEKVLEFKPYTEDNCWKQKEFAMAIHRLIDNPALGVIYQKLQHKLWKPKIQRQANSTYYLRHFEFILNAGLKKEENFIKLLI